MFFSLRNRLFLIFTLLLTFPFLVLSFIIPSWFTSEIEAQTEDYTLDMMDQYSLYMDSIATQAEDLGKQVLVNQTTQQWLQLEKEDAALAELHFIRNELRSWLSSMTLNNSNTMSTSVFLNDGTGIWINHPFLSEVEWYKDYSENNQRWIRAHTDAYQQQYQQNYVNSFIIPLYDIYTLSSSGVIKVNLPTSLLETALNKVKLGENGRVYLLNNQGENVLTGGMHTPESVLDDSLKRIVNSRDKQGLIETAHNGEEYLVFFQKLTVGDWVLFSEITKSELFFKIDELQKRLLLTSAIIFILTIIASYLFSTNIVRPLGKLNNAMGYMERGDFTGAKQNMPSKLPKHEIGYLIKVFDQTIDRLNSLIKIEYEANIRRKDAEYKALLLQINPHFMNNTLEIIGGLAAQGKNKDVINVSVHLGRMMVYSLNTHSDVVTLGQEINYIRNFTDILKVRYEDAISIKIVEDPKTKSLPIIKFIVQPLVENAAKYSFIENTYAEITIRTKKESNLIYISVEDNGIGMSEEVIADIMSEDFNSDTTNVLASTGTSIGLKNVLGRLKLYYGDDFSFRIDTQKDQGTKITLCIKIKGDIHDESSDM
ncbi:sensor histidine kinase [Sutcliffiella deserti]|uniref:sensor histidine kinase n=1 Tax=Sutcliffiella deserti TaxID=2875501 RepID=UPI001CBED69C|nr:sensor histidine kinase [Sutcliffiella deserti]